MERKPNAYATLLLGVTLLAGCTDDPEIEPAALSGFTIVNSFIEADAALYQLDGTYMLLQGQPLRYRDMNFYTVASGNSRKLEIISSNELAKLVDTTLAIQENVYHTSFLFGTEAAPKHFLTVDRIPEGTDNPAAIAAVRFFNLANTPHHVTLHIAETEPIAAFRDRPTETPETGKATEGFIPTTNTGTHVLIIRNEEGEQLARRTGVALDPGDYLTVFLTGDQRDPASYYVGVLRQRVN